MARTNDSHDAPVLATGEHNHFQSYLDERRGRLTWYTHLDPVMSLSRTEAGMEAEKLIGDYCERGTSVSACGNSRDDSVVSSLSRAKMEGLVCI
mmetsp:Transcript_26096/g.71890  ORF Transcript_26096/g.71890 Transcript_26096/m.71890 type:complete len:94 (+) Transcript_26096:716-997(+)